MNPVLKDRDLGGIDLWLSWYFAQSFHVFDTELLRPPKTLLPRIGSTKWLVYVRLFYRWNKTLATAQCGSSFLLHHFVTIFSSYIGHAIFKCGVVHPCWKRNYNHYVGIWTILPIEGPIVFSQSVSIAWLTNLLMFCRWYILDRLICLIDPYRRSQTKITQWFQVITQWP